MAQEDRCTEFFAAAAPVRRSPDRAARTISSHDARGVVSARNLSIWRTASAWSVGLVLLAGLAMVVGGCSATKRTHVVAGGKPAVPAAAPSLALHTSGHVPGIPTLTINLPSAPPGYHLLRHTEVTAAGFSVDGKLQQGTGGPPQHYPTEIFLLGDDQTMSEPPVLGALPKHPSIEVLVEPASNGPLSNPAQTGFVPLPKSSTTSGSDSRRLFVPKPSASSGSDNASLPASIALVVWPASPTITVSVASVAGSVPQVIAVASTAILEN